MLRVTDPKTTETTRQSPKPKDPRKVATGRAGAASRRKKQERLLEELQKAKEAQWDAESTSDAPPDRELKDPPVPAKPAVEEKIEKSTPAVGFAIGAAAALLGIIYLVASRRAPPVALQQTPKKLVTPPPPAEHLNVSDPFHME